MEYPCKSCTTGRGGNCICQDWADWFAEKWDAFHEAPQEQQKVTYRDIVFWTVFTELWRKV